MIRLTRFLSIAACTLAMGNAFATSPVRDINTSPVGNGSLLSDWTTIGSVTYFLIGTAQYGEELWRTDGTRAGTRLVKDIFPGPGDSGITSMQAVDGVLYFFADDGTNGHELWRSDGSVSGTRIVADITPGSDGGVASSDLVSMGGVVYFVGSVEGDAELWRSNGTAAGTRRVADICPGDCASYPEQLTVVGSRLFFIAADQGTGPELWTSDGTSAGTRRVVDILPGSQGSDARHMTATSAGLFFVATDLEHGTELWFANAGGNSAAMVRDMTPGPASSTFSSMGVLGPDVVLGGITPGNPLVASGSIHNLFRASGAGTVQVLAEGLPLNSGVAVPASGFVPLGTKLLFPGSDPASPADLWVTDGTRAGTQRLGTAADLTVTSLISGDADLIVGNHYFFQAYSGAPGNEIDLWRTDGTEAGTQRYARLPQPFVHSDMAYFNGRVFFAGDSPGSHGAELWSTDGTESGTTLFADLLPGETGSHPSLFALAGDHLLFTTGDVEPWSTDGTVEGTQPLLPALPKPTESSDPQAITRLGDRVVFFANDGVHGIEPWVSDGTVAGTRLLRDLQEGEMPSYPTMLGTAGARVFFSAHTDEAGKEVWVTDGTPAGTYMVRDIRDGPESSNPAPFYRTAALDDVIYFPADDGVNGEQLWRSDGTFAGTFAVTNLPADRSWCFSDIKPLNGRILMLLCESGGMQFWWQSDGTAAGTTRVSNAVSVSGSSGAVVMGGWLYFAGQATPHPDTTRHQLWRTDGTEAGTMQLSHLEPGADFTAVGGLWAMSGSVLFSFCAPTCRLYGTDASGTGLHFVAEDPIAGHDVAALGNRLIYIAHAPSGGPVLRSTDGTAGGTFDVLPPKANGEILGWLTSVNGQVLFTQVDPELGPSVWRTNGTATGAVLVADLDPTPDVTVFPNSYTFAGGLVFLNGFNAGPGAELYAISPGVPNAGDDVATTTFGEAVTIAVTANDGTITGTINPATTMISSTPAGGTISAGASVGIFVYTPNTGFQGTDHFTYTVADMAGNRSKSATVFVTVAPPSGPAPGGPGSGPGPGPDPGPDPTPDPDPQTPGGGKGGGGGASGLALVLLALMLGIARMKRNRCLH